MPKCPKCKNGKMTIHLVNDNTDMEIDCIHCEGTGKLTDERIAQIEANDKWMKENMCHCDDSTFGSYPEDGECDCGMYKQHVHCGGCGKISQIG